MEKDFSVKRAIVHGTLATSFGAWGLRVVGLVTSIIIIRELTLYQYGLMELVGTLSGFLGIFLLPGIENVGVSLLSSALGRKDFGMAKKIIYDYFYSKLFFGFIAWAVLFFGAHIIGNYYNAEIENSIKISAFFFLLSPIRSIIGTLFNANLSFFLKNIYAILEDAIKLILIYFIFFYANIISIQAIFFATVASQVIALIFIAPSAYKQWRPIKSAPKVVNKNFFSILSGEGKWGIFSNYSNGLGQNIRLWLIKIILGTESVAIFSFASALWGHLVSLVALSQILNPIFSKINHDTQRLSRVLAKTLKYQFLAYFILGIVAFFAAPYFIKIFFPKYEPSLFLFRIILLTIVPASFANIFTPLFYSFKSQKDLFISVNLKNLYIFIFTIVFASLFGIVGTAIEFICTISLFSIERYIRLRRLIPSFRISLSSFFTYDTYDAMILSSILRKIRGFGFIRK